MPLKVFAFLLFSFKIYFSILHASIYFLKLKDVLILQFWFINKILGWCLYNSMVLSIKKFGSPFESIEISLLTLKLGGLTAF